MNQKRSRTYHIHFGDGVEAGDRDIHGDLEWVHFEGEVSEGVGEGEER